MQDATEDPITRPMTDDDGNCEGGPMSMLNVPTPVSTRGQPRMRVQSGVSRNCNDLTILMNS